MTDTTTDKTTDATDKSKVIIPTSKGSEEIAEKRHNELVPFTSPSRATDAEKANVTPSPVGKPLVNTAALAARSESIVSEKSVIVLLHKSGRSKVWDYMKPFKFSTGFDAKKDGTAVHKLLHESLSDAEKQRFICSICFADPTKCLNDCHKALPYGKPANGMHHLKSSHRNVWEAAATGSGAGSSSGGHQQLLVEAFSNSATTRTNVMSKFEYILFRFINDNGISYSVVDKSNFRELITFIIENAAYLKALGYEFTGRYRLREVQHSHFNALVQFVSAEVREVRDYYAKVTGRRQPFLVVSHDDWDGNTRDIRGISIMFVHPLTFKYSQIAVILLPPDGKKSIDICNDAMHGLERYLIDAGDLYAPVNDTTTSAGKFAVRLIICVVLNLLKERPIDLPVLSLRYRYMVLLPVESTCNRLRGTCIGVIWQMPVLLCVLDRSTLLSRPR